MGCSKDQLIPPENLIALPEGFPPLPFPADNPPTRASIELGRQLFFEKVLSIDSSISCGTCHRQKFAFADSLSTTPGVENRPGTRNAPSLANVGYHPYFLKEGGVPTLEMQVLVPIQEHNELANNILIIAERLNMDSSYVNLSQQAYGRYPDPFVITRSISNYERTLVSGNSAYDLWSNNKGSLMPAEERGRQLFFGEKAKCSQCHSDFNFTNYEFFNTGLYEEYADMGRFRLTGDSTDIGRFKVPSLRNVGLTAPYMHDGSMDDLKMVLKHYASGGEAHANRDSRINRIEITEQDQEDLIAFLHALSDFEFIARESISEPY